MTATARFPRASANHRFAMRVLTVAVLSLLPALALAKQSDRQQPMDYVAKSTEAFNAPNTVTTLKGSVKITQGSLLISGDLARIYLDADTQIARVVVTGNPAHIQQLDDSGNLMTGDAATLDYDNIHDIAVLSGHAVVKQQGRGQFEGDKLTYNTATSQITGEASGDGLVHGVFLPKPKPAAAPSGAATPAPASSAPAQEHH